MTRKSSRIKQEEQEQFNNDKMAREEAIEMMRRNMQKSNHEHMESIIDGISEHGLEVIKYPIFQQASRTISNQVVTYQTRIFTSPVPP